MLVAKELIHCQLRPAMRQQTLVQALRSKAKRIPVPGTNLELLAESESRKQIDNGLRMLHEAEGAVVRKAPMSCTANRCIRGTRVPVYMIGRLANTLGLAETLATYPHLTERQITLAQRFKYSLIRARDHHEGSVCQWKVAW